MCNIDEVILVCPATSGAVINMGLPCITRLVNKRPLGVPSLIIEDNDPPERRRGRPVRPLVMAPGVSEGDRLLAFYGIVVVVVESD